MHEQGLASVLKQIHDDLDTAVFGAYGWPADLTDDTTLERLVALDGSAAEEYGGAGFAGSDSTSRRLLVIRPPRKRR